MFDSIIAALRAQRPLVHCITNYVTANDCANVLLACGASPIMADDISEVEEITALSRSLVLNLGTLHQQTVPAMRAAARRAQALGHPIVLDPVGVGASIYRTQTAKALLTEANPTVVRGNISEIKALAYGMGATGGVDAAVSDRVTAEGLADAVAFAKAFALNHGCVVAITGEIDIVADASRAFCIYNGSARMRLVTGAGCQLSALVAAYVAAAPENALTAAAAAVCTMGLCGELAERRMTVHDGSGSYRIYLMDAVSNLTPAQLERGARYEVR